MILDHHPWPLHRLPTDLHHTVVLARGAICLDAAQPCEQCPTTERLLEDELDRIYRDDADIGALTRRAQAEKN